MSCSHNPILFIFIYLHACAHHSTHVDIRGHTWSWVSCFTMCVPGIKLRFRRPSIFSHSAISLVPLCFLIKPLVLPSQTFAPRHTLVHSDPVHSCLFWSPDTPPPSSYLGVCYPQDASLLGFTRTLKPALFHSHFLV